MALILDPKLEVKGGWGRRGSEASRPREGGNPLAARCHLCASASLPPPPHIHQVPEGGRCAYRVTVYTADERGAGTGAGGEWA